MNEIRLRGPIVGAAMLMASCGADERLPGFPDAAIDARPPALIDAACQGLAGRPRVLVYTRETNWMHTSNPLARQALLDMCETRGFTVTASADPNVFTAMQLSQIDVVVFSQTSGTVLDEFGRNVLETWLRAGGGYVGFHAASGTEWDWPFYLDFLGTRFHTHAPGTWAAQITFDTTAHPITQGLSAWTRADEWYVFFTPPEATPGMQMLFSLDEDSLDAAYPAENKIGYHPIAWVHERFGGRFFYTGMGHTDESFAEPEFLEIIGRAIEWTAGP